MGTGVRDGGETVTSGRRTVWVAPACFYRQSLTGAEYAAAWSPGGNFTQLQHHLPPEDNFEPWAANYLDYADIDGHWYCPTCDDERFPSTEEYLAGYHAFRATHDIVYVEVNDTPPNAQVVPPETLAQLAFEHTDLPDGQLQWNPRLTGSGATLVGMDTWVWLDNPVVQVQVTAEIPGLSATVVSVFTAMNLEADGIEPVTCTGTPGTAWTSGASTGCAIVFDRSSANQPVKAGQSLPTRTLTANARWQASWTSSAAPGVHEMTDPQVVTYTAEIPVGEMQTVVTR